jgi:hypothetical protein
MRWLACVLVVVAVAGCGGSSSSQSRSASGGASSRAAWAAQTQQLCREKRASLAQLGGVHITYAGIARVGLPTVKRSLDGYLGRVLRLLQTYSRRQQQLRTPPSVAAAMTAAMRADRESQAATVRARREVTTASSPAQFSAAFAHWTATLQQLSARGDALARQLGLTECVSR